MDTNNLKQAIENYEAEYGSGAAQKIFREILNLFDGILEAVGPNAVIASEFYQDTIEPPAPCQNCEALKREIVELQAKLYKAKSREKTPEEEALVVLLSGEYTLSELWRGIMDLRTAREKVTKNGI